MKQALSTKHNFIHKEVKLLMLGFADIIVYLSIAWIFMPRISGIIQQVNGMPIKHESCSSRSCEYGIKINEIRLACGVSAIGTSYSCRDFYNSDYEAQAKYFSMPTLLSVVGLSSPSQILIEMRQNGVIVYEKSLSQLRKSYFFPPTFVSIIVFVISFLAIKKHPYFN